VVHTPVAEPTPPPVKSAPPPPVKSAPVVEPTPAVKPSAPTFKSAPIVEPTPPIVEPTPPVVKPTLPVVEPTPPVVDPAPLSSKKRPAPRPPSAVIENSSEKKEEVPVAASVTVTVTSPIVTISDAGSEKGLAPRQVALCYDTSESSTDNDSLPVNNGEASERFVSVVTLTENQQSFVASPPVGQKLDESEVLILNTSSVVPNGVVDGSYGLDFDPEDPDDADVTEDAEDDESGIVDQGTTCDVCDVAVEREGRREGSRSDLSNLSQVSSLSGSRSSLASEPSSFVSDRRDEEPLSVLSGISRASIIVEGDQSTYPSLVVEM